MPPRKEACRNFQRGREIGGKKALSAQRKIKEAVDLAGRSAGALEAAYTQAYGKGISICQNLVLYPRDRIFPPGSAIPNA